MTQASITPATGLPSGGRWLYPVVEPAATDAPIVHSDHGTVTTEAVPPAGGHDTSGTRPLLPGAFTATELVAMTFPEPRWAVPGLIAEGVSLLCGPPKVGKSWLSLHLGIAIAGGGTAMDRIPVQAGPVLYLALEDTARRLQSRLLTLLDGNPAPDGLTIATTCPPLPSGGDAVIAEWIEANPSARLVVIDVFAKMRGTAAPGASAYDADYAAVGRAKRVADHYGVAVVLVHHVRKAGADDFLAEVSGTNGLAGAADAVLVLKRARNRADGVLHITGRDVDEAEHALAWEAERGLWRLLDGSAAEHTMGGTRATVLAHLRQHPGSRPSETAEALGLDRDTVKQTCKRMLDDAQLRVQPGGRYFTVENLTGDSAGDSDPAQRLSPLSPCHRSPPDQPKHR